MSYERIPRDPNRVPITAGVSTADGVTAVPIEVDPVTGQLQVTDSTNTDGSQVTKIKETVPTDPLKNNPAYSLNWTGNKITTITETIGTTPYNYTLSYDVDGKLTSVSKAV